MLKKSLMAVLVAGVIASPFAYAEKHAPASKSRYVIKGGEVYDKKTELTWQRCSIGQHWKDDAGCVGVVKEFTFDQAQQQASGQWRVPSKDELATLIDYKKAEAKQKPTIDEDAFPDMDESKLWYWTSTPEGASLGRGVSFLDGVHYGGRSEAYAVRLVRSGQ